MRLTSTLLGREHHVSVPDHHSLKVGTLRTIVSLVAAYLERDRDEVAEELFGRS
jgi:hypothetical protein